MKYKSFVVFGLGKFGQAIADKLLESGADVMVADNDEDIIEQYSAKATTAIEAARARADIPAKSLETFIFLFLHVNIFGGIAF